MSFAHDITPEEAALGFARVEELPHGVIVTAQLGIGLRAVKVVERGVVSYAICDDNFVMLYAPARSVDELRARFELGESRRAG